MSDTLTARDAIIECFQAHATLTVADVQNWIEKRYPGRWKAIDTALADLATNGNETSTYAERDKCLKRTERGTYRMNGPN